jgi:hypothetical protein
MAKSLWNGHIWKKLSFLFGKGEKIGTSIAIKNICRLNGHGIQLVIKKEK